MTLDEADAKVDALADELRDADVDLEEIDAKIEELKQMRNRAAVRQYAAALAYKRALVEVQELETAIARGRVTG